MKLLSGVVPYISHQVALLEAEYQLNIELLSFFSGAPCPASYTPTLWSTCP